MFGPSKSKQNPLRVNSRSELTTASIADCTRKMSEETQAVFDALFENIADKKILLDNIDKIHTTEMGMDRIKKNLKIDTLDAVEYCKNKILDRNCNIYKLGKNWYCEIDNIKITINSYSYTIITAHMIKS